MKKRILSLLCVLALCLGLLPVTALAEGTAPQTLYVGSTTISAGYWTSSDGGTTWARQENQPEGNNYIYYDGQGTLKLHNVTIQRGSNTVSPPYGAGIYALCSSNQEYHHRLLWDLCECRDKRGQQWYRRLPDYYE